MHELAHFIWSTCLLIESCMSPFFSIQLGVDYLKIFIPLQNNKFKRKKSSLVNVNFRPGREKEKNCKAVKEKDWNHYFLLCGKLAWKNFFIVHEKSVRRKNFVKINIYSRAKIRSFCSKALQNRKENMRENRIWYFLSSFFFALSWFLVFVACFVFFFIHFYFFNFFLLSHE